MINKLHAQLYAEILDRIKWNSKPHSPEIKEAARNPKCTISPSLMWAEGVGGSNVSIYFVQECVCNVQYTPRGDCRNYTRVNCVQHGGLMSPRPPPPPPASITQTHLYVGLFAAFEMWKPNVIPCTSFQQLLDMLKFYTGFEINDVTGKNLVYKCASVYFTLPSFI